MTFDLPYDEDRLLMQIRTGDQSAFATVFRRHYSPLITFAQCFVPVDKAEDILSETFIKLWESRAVFSSEAQLHQWLKVTVRNAALNYIRQQKTISSRLREMIGRLKYSFEEEYFKSTVESMLFSRILSEIESLAPRQRRILKMFFLEGSDNSTIASELGISVQAVKNQKVTALKILRRIFPSKDLVRCLVSAAFFLPF